MTQHLGRPIVASVGLLAATWVLATLVLKLAHMVSDSSIVLTVSMLACVSAGLFAAVRLRAGVATTLLSAFASYLLAEGAAHIAFGSDAVQGREVHLTLMAAALISSLLGSVLGRGHRATADAAHGVEGRFHATEH